jgi:predicted thioesterase
MLIGLIEMTCMRATDHALEDGRITLGVGFEIRHLAPTPVGEEISIVATLKSVEGRMLIYDVSATDRNGAIAEGVHQRAMVSAQSFGAKIELRTAGV